MKSKIHLTFPCTQNWDDMESIGNESKHCSTCNKCVTNFQNLSPQQLQTEIKKQGGQVCGVYRLDQLDNIHQQFFTKNFKYLTVSVLSLLGLFAQTIKANGQAPQLSQPNISQNDSTQVVDTLNFPITISGRLRDKETLMVAAGAKILVIQHGQVIKTVSTNSKGRFNFELNKKELTDSLITLQVMYNFPRKQSSKQFSVVNDETLVDASFDLQLSGIPTYYLLRDTDVLPLTRKSERHLNILGGAVSIISEEHPFIGGTIRWRKD